MANLPCWLMPTKLTDEGNIFVVVNVELTALEKKNKLSSRRLANGSNKITLRKSTLLGGIGGQSHEFVYELQ